MANNRKSDLEWTHISKEKSLNFHLLNHEDTYNWSKWYAW